MSVDYHLLQTFIIAAEQPTFAQTAKRCGLTASAVSQQIRTLEARLGVPLFERVRRQVRLTPQGKALSHAIRSNFQQIDRALEVLREDHRALSGRVHVGGSGPFARRWVQARIAPVAQRHPDLEIVVTFDTAEVIDRKLEDGRLDLAVVFGEQNTSLLNLELIHYDRFTAIASTTYLNEHGTPKTPSEFAAHRFVLHDVGHPYVTMWWKAHFRRSPPKTLRAACCVDHFDVLIELVRQGLGVGIVPLWLADEVIASAGDSLKRIDPPRRGKKIRVLFPKKPAYLAWRKQAVETGRFAAVRDALLAERGSS